MLESKCEQKCQEMWFTVTSEEFSEYLNLDAILNFVFLSSC